MKRTFIQMSRAWYGNANLKHRYDNKVDEVMLHVTSDDDKVTHEFVVAWYNLLNRNPPSPKLEIYDDEWDGLPHIQDLIQSLPALGSKRNSIQPPAFCKVLERLGFEDVTPENNPYEKDDENAKNAPEKV